MGQQLFFVSHAFKLKIHSFVLMDNHFHLIATAPNANLSEAMAFFLRETSRELQKNSNRINRTWGGRFFRSRLGNYHYFMAAYKYVYRNPVEAGSSETAEDYPYSTLSGLLGKNRIIIPVVEDTLLFDSSTDETLNWLNRKPTDEDREDVRKALRKSEFKYSQDTKNKRAHPLESRLY